MQTLKKLYEAAKPEPLYLDQFGNYCFKFKNTGIMLMVFPELDYKIASIASEKAPTTYFFTPNEYSKKMPSFLEKAKEYALENYVVDGNKLKKEFRK